MRLVSPYTAATLQKQVGCLNHRVVTLVTYQLGRQWSLLEYWLWELYLSIGSIRQPERQLLSSSYNHNTLTTLIRTFMKKESLQMDFRVAAKQMIITSQISWGFQYVVVVRWIGQLPLSGCLMQLVSHNHHLFSYSGTRVTTLWLKQPIFLQFAALNT